MDIMLEKCRRGDDFEPDKQRLVAFHNRMSGDNHTEYFEQKYG
jgi:ethanolamine utilization protein EutP (predicted NTPase)